MNGGILQHFNTSFHDGIIHILFGCIANTGLYCRGFYPVGGGQVRVTVNPVQSLSSILLLDRGEITRISGISYAAGHVPLEVGDVILCKCSKPDR